MDGWWMGDGDHYADSDDDNDDDNDNENNDCDNDDGDIDDGNDNDNEYPLFWRHLNRWFSGRELAVEYRNMHLGMQMSWLLFNLSSTEYRINLRSANINEFGYHVNISDEISMFLMYLHSIVYYQI